MTRLYVQIYLAFVAVGTLSVFASAVAVVVLFGRPMDGPTQVAIAAAIAVSELPPTDDPGFDASLRGLRADLGQDLTVWDPAGREVASTGPTLPFGPVGAFRAGGANLGVRVELPDRRIVAISRVTDPSRRRQGWAWVVAVALGMGVGCYPLARRFTRRLEQVERAMERWGAGELDARVPVRGSDEVARVAVAFNRAADRVERLVEAQRRTLASASHELRAPLSRLRVAVELLGEGAPALGAVTAGAVTDVEDLDATVGDLLQVGRMQATDGPSDPQPVDLRAVAVDEAVRLGATVSGPTTVVRGDPRLLRRLVRNLVENAIRYGAPPIEVVIGDAGLEVLDRGPGVPEALREQVFAPFFRPPGHAEGRDGGVGLGLHLVREIARHHGGDVRVEPRDGGGARFVVWGLATVDGAATVDSAAPRRSAT